jgi:DHA2 family multidrug resistance protein-like MFS transporter
MLVGNTQWDGVEMPRRIGAICAVAFGVSISVLNGTIANVALPTMAKELGVSDASSIWIVNAYQISTMVALLLFSTLGDIVGYRKVYLGGLFVLTFSSAACSLSHTFGLLITFRVVQGLAAAAVAGVNTSLIRVIYPKRHLGRGMGMNATVVALAAVAGPSLASAVLTVGSWPWLFAVSIPFALVAIVLGCVYLPKNPVKNPDISLNWMDGIVNMFFIVLLVLSFEGISQRWKLLWVVLPLTFAIVVGYFFIRSQSRKTYPLLPIDLFRIPIFSISVCTSACSFTAQMCALVSLPFFLQHQMGYDAVQTGLLMTSWPAIIMFVAPLAGYLVEHVHAGILGAIGLAVMAVGLFTLAFVPRDAGSFGIVWRLMLCGAGFGFFQSPNNSIMIGSAPQYRSGSASGILGMARLTGQTTGAALVALLFHLTANSAHLAFLIGAGFAIGSAILSSMRISLALPQDIRHKSKLLLSDKTFP